MPRGTFKTLDPDPSQSEEGQEEHEEAQELAEQLLHHGSESDGESGAVGADDQPAEPEPTEGAAQAVAQPPFRRQHLNCSGAGIPRADDEPQNSSLLILMQMVILNTSFFSVADMRDTGNTIIVYMTFVYMQVHESLF